MKISSLQNVLDALRPDIRVFISGTSGENLALIDLLRSTPEKLAGVELWSTLVPGINAFDYGALHSDVRVVTFMSSVTLDPSIASNRTRVLNLPYSGMARTLADTAFDLALLHTAPPDEHGRLSFGVAGDFGPIVRKSAKHIIALANTHMPAPPRAPFLNASDVDLVVSADAPLVEARPEPDLSEDMRAIGQHAAALIHDGAVIQSGIGQAPCAVLRALTGHKKLRIRSGLITPEYRLLAEAGALADADHVAGIAFGPANFYGWLANADLCRFTDTFETHDADAIAATPAFTSINSALEVDLSGALNIEWLRDRRVSGVGGAPDFMAGAAASPGGRSVIALPAASRGVSRIVAKLDPARVSISGDLTDCIVTPFGAAQIKGLSGDARARALIAVAAPEHREVLERDWRALR